MSTTLTIRNLDETVKHKLRLRAALHQQSMEAEAREILARGVAEAPSADLKMTPQERMRQGIAAVKGLFGSHGTTDELMKELRGDD